MTVSRSHSAIDADVYFPLAERLMPLLISHGLTYTSLNALCITLAQVVTDAKNGSTGGTPIITQNVPLAAFPVASA